MPATVRLNKKELVDLIETTEAASCDASCLRGLLAEVEEEEQRRQPARRRVSVEARPEEMATEERLDAEVGYLFPEGLTQDILNMCIEYDLNYSLTELRKMCIDAGLSPSGHKKLLAAKLIARQRRER